MNDEIEEKKEIKEVKEQGIGQQSNLIFLSNFVHQVVNPLNGICGTLDNYVEGVFDQATGKKKINAVRAQLEQCISLIRNLAFFAEFSVVPVDSSGERGLKAPTKYAKADLTSIVLESVQFFQDTAREKNMALELIRFTHPFTVSARPELIRQVFMNIFDNWVKYGYPDQKVKVKGSINRKSDLIIEISGYSKGFSNADAERIFELGFRSTEAKSTLAQGSGIGLWVCKAIMDNVGGKISASHSARDEKTVFRITIPNDLWA